MTFLFCNARLVVFLVDSVKSNFLMERLISMRWHWDWEKKPSAAPLSRTDTTSSCRKTHQWVHDQPMNVLFWSVKSISDIFSFCRNATHLHRNYDSFLGGFHDCAPVLSCLALDGFLMMILLLDLMWYVWYGCDWHFNTFSAVFPFSNVTSCWWRPEISSKYPW